MVIFKDVHFAALGVSLIVSGVFSTSAQAGIGSALTNASHKLGIYSNYERNEAYEAEFNRQVGPLEPWNPNETYCQPGDCSENTPPKETAAQKREDRIEDQKREREEDRELAEEKAKLQKEARSADRAGADHYFVDEKKTCLSSGYTYVESGFNNVDNCFSKKFLNHPIVTMPNAEHYAPKGSNWIDVSEQMGHMSGRDFVNPNAEPSYYEAKGPGGCLSAGAYSFKFYPADAEFPSRCDLKEHHAKVGFKSCPASTIPTYGLRQNENSVEFFPMYCSKPSQLSKLQDARLLAIPTKEGKCSDSTFNKWFEGKCMKNWPEFAQRGGKCLSGFYPVGARTDTGVPGCLHHEDLMQVGSFKCQYPQKVQRILGGEGTVLKVSREGVDTLNISKSRCYFENGVGFYADLRCTVGKDGLVRGQCALSETIQSNVLGSSVTSAAR